MEKYTKYCDMICQTFGGERIYWVLWQQRYVRCKETLVVLQEVQYCLS